MTIRSISLASLAAAMMLGPATVPAGPPHCPPGHQKKGWCTPGQASRLPPDQRGRVIEDWSRHDLPAPGRGREYVVVDGEVFLVLDATREVIEAVGAVERLLNY